MLLSLVTVTAILQAAVATNLSPPILYSRHAHGSQHGSLEKRTRCADGSQCLLGTCCGDGCAVNCCALDNGGLGCGIAQRCQFEGNVFVGCCGNFLGGCTSEATRVTVHTPYSTVTLGGTDAMTATGSSTTTTTEQMFTAISVTSTATRTTTTATESESVTGSSSHSHRVSASASASSSSVTDAETTTSNSARSPTTTAASSQTSSSPKPNNNGGAGMVGLGVGMPVLAGMVALGAVLL